MKNVITLTKTLTLAALLLVFAGASATSFNSEGDKDTTKCKKHCCKTVRSEKEIEQSIKELNEAMNELTITIKTLDAVKVQTQVANALARVPVKVFVNGDRFVFVQSADEAVKGSSKQKIDFNNLNKEMDQVQEDMSQMDPVLKNDDVKNRKAADEILKTGIRS